MSTSSSAAPGPTGVHDLPNETLLHVFKIVRSSLAVGEHAPLAALALVCRKWSTLAQLVLLEFVRLDGSLVQAQRFESFLQRVPQAKKIVRTLAVIAPEERRPTRVVKDAVAEPTPATCGAPACGSTSRSVLVAPGMMDMAGAMALVGLLADVDTVIISRLSLESLAPEPGQEERSLDGAAASVVSHTLTTLVLHPPTPPPALQSQEPIAALPASVLCWIARMPALHKLRVRRCELALPEERRPPSFELRQLLLRGCTTNARTAAALFASSCASLGSLAIRNDLLEDPAELSTLLSRLEGSLSSLDFSMKRVGYGGPQGLAVVPRLANLRSLVVTTETLGRELSDVVPSLGSLENLQHLGITDFNLTQPWAQHFAPSKLRLRSLQADLRAGHVSEQVGVDLFTPSIPTLTTLHVLLPSDPLGRSAAVTIAALFSDSVVAVSLDCVTDRSLAPTRLGLLNRLEAVCLSEPMSWTSQRPDIPAMLDGVPPSVRHLTVCTDQKAAYVAGWASELRRRIVLGDRVLSGVRSLKIVGAEPGWPGKEQAKCKAEADAFHAWCRGRGIVVPLAEAELDPEPGLAGMQSYFAAWVREVLPGRGANA